MKRSEMIQQLIEWSISTNIANLPIEEQWSKLLYKLESLGMLPPYRDVMIEGHQCDDNSWEPEELKSYLCRKCNGSGEGYYDGTVCDACKGSGVES